MIVLTYMIEKNMIQNPAFDCHKLHYYIILTFVQCLLSTNILFATKTYLPDTS